MELRKVRDEEEARAALTAAAGSGLSRRSWARSNGVDPRSLNAWRVNLSRRGRQPAAPLQLVEVTPMPVRTAAVYAIVTEGVRLEVGDDFDEATLRRLLSVVRAC